MKITAKNFSAVHRAFELIARDNGAINRFEDRSEGFEIPTQDASQLVIINAALLRLTDEELQDFCTTEVGEQAALADRSVSLTAASEFLDRFFNEWL